MPNASSQEPLLSSQEMGVLLVQLGTPTAPEAGPVGRFLREFLSDPSVIDLPAILRWPLVHLLIVPRRAQNAAQAYRKIWTSRGSPLLVNSEALRAALDTRLSKHPVELGMRYGEPSIPAALERLRSRGCARVICLPLYPHATQSSTGTAARAVQEAAAAIPDLQVELLPAYYDHASWIEAVRATAATPLAKARADHVLFSFHGLPERHIEKADARGDCLRTADCCATFCEANRHCYKAQCLASAQAIAEALGLDSGAWSVSFQSGIGRRWLLPSTEETLQHAAHSGVRRLAVITPGFAADCLETLEELCIRGADQFRAAGGEELFVLPCLNAEPEWVTGLSELLTPHLRGAS